MQRLSLILFLTPYKMKPFHGSRKNTQTKSAGYAKSTSARAALTLFSYLCDFSTRLNG